MAQRYSGTLSKVGNCLITIIVAAEYVPEVTGAGSPLHWPVSGQPYLPQGWADDAERREGTEVPAAVRFATKHDMNLGMGTGCPRSCVKVPFGRVTSEVGYGSDPGFLDGLGSGSP